VAANDERSGVAAGIFGQRQAVRTVAVLRVGHGHRIAPAVTVRCWDEHIHGAAVEAVRNGGTG
jgi:hypothetical protein